MVQVVEPFGNDAYPVDIRVRNECHTNEIVGGEDHDEWARAWLAADPERWAWLWQEMPWGAAPPPEVDFSRYVVIGERIDNCSSHEAHLPVRVDASGLVQQPPAGYTPPPPFERPAVEPRLGVVEVPAPGHIGLRTLADGRAVWVSGRPTRRSRSWPRRWLRPEASPSPGCGPRSSWPSGAQLLHVQPGQCPRYNEGVHTGPIAVEWLPQAECAGQRVLDHEPRELRAGAD